MFAILTLTYGQLCPWSCSGGEMITPGYDKWGDFEFWAKRPGMYPKPPPGYNIDDMANTSHNYYNPALFDNSNPTIDPFIGHQWYDFMGQRIKKRIAEFPDANCLVLIDDLAQKPWVAPFANIAIFYRDSEHTGANVKFSTNFLLYDFSATSTGEPNLRDNIAKIAAMCGAFAHSPQIALLADIGTDTSQLNSFMSISGLLVVDISRIADMGKDKHLYQNYLRLQENEMVDASVVSNLLLSMWGGYGYKKANGYFDQSTPTYNLEALVLANDFGLAIVSTSLIKVGANKHSEPSRDEIKQLLWDPVDLSLHHANAVYVQDYSVCQAYDFLHKAFPLLVGAGMIWISRLISFEHYAMYTAELVQNAMSDAMAKANPMDGQVQFIETDASAKQAEFKKFIEKAFLTSKEAWEPWAGISAEIITDALTNKEDELFKQVDAFMFAMATSVETSVQLGANNATPYEYFFNAMQLQHEGVANPIQINSGTGDRSDMRETYSIRRGNLQNESCKAGRNPCENLRLCEDNAAECSSLWVECMQKQPQWDTIEQNKVVDLVPTYVTRTERAYLGDNVRQMVAVRFENQFETYPFQYFCCSTTQPPYNDPGKEFYLNPLDSSSAYKCPDGRYYDAIMNECLKCQVGYLAVPGASERQCTACPAGKFQNELGSSECKLCPKGTYQSDSAMTQCNLCALGYHAPRFVSTSCQMCLPGRFTATEGNEICTVCVTGKYQSTAGNSYCDACSGTLTTQIIGSQDPSDCKCAGGFYQRNKECVYCKTKYGATADGVLPVQCNGFGEPPILNADFMTRLSPSIQDVDVVFWCNNAPQMCPGLVPIGEDSCAAGTIKVNEELVSWSAQGVACGLCSNLVGNDGKEIKMMKSGNTACKACGKGGSIAFIILCVLGTMVLIKRMRPKTVSYSDTFIINDVHTMFITLPIVQFVEFAQMCMIFNRTSVSWPKESTQTFNTISNIFNLSLFDLPCLLGGGRDNAALKQVCFLNSFPLILIIVILLLCLPGLLIPNIRRFKPPNMYKGVNTILTMLQTFFVTVLMFSITLVLTHYPHPQSDYYSLVVFPYLLADDEEVSSMTMVATLALSVWCAGTLAMFATCVSLRAWKTEWRIVQRCTVATAIKYADPKNVWVLEDMVVKLLACLSPVFATGMHKQMQNMGVLLVLHLCLLTWVAPFRFTRHSVHDVLQNICKLGVILCSDAALGGDNSDGTPIMFFLLLGAIFFFVVECSCLFDFYRGRCDPQDDSAVVDNLLSSTEPLLAIQQWIDLCLGNERDICVFLRPGDQYEKAFSIQTKKIDAMRDAFLLKALDPKHKYPYLELRGKQADCLNAVMLGQNDSAAKSMQDQKQIIEKFT